MLETAEFLGVIDAAVQDMTRSQNAYSKLTFRLRDMDVMAGGEISISHEPLDDFVEEGTRHEAAEAGEPASSKAYLYLKSWVRLVMDEIICSQAKVGLLNLSRNFADFGETGSLDAATALSCDPIVLGLDISENHITERGAFHLADGLQRNSMLRFLDISNNELGDAGASALVHALKHHQCMEEIRLRECGITEQSAKKIADMITRTHSLEKIDLSMNKIGRRGAVEIFDKMRHNMIHLKHLDLSHNDIEHTEAAEAIREFLGLNVSIESMCLANNPLGDAAVAIICEGLVGNARIKRIDLTATQFGSVAANSLQAVLTSHICTIQRIDLADNNISGPECDCIVDGLGGGNQHLTSLGLSGNPIPQSSIRALLAVLPRSKILHLHLARIAALGATEAQNIAELIKSSKLSLELLDISDAPIDENGASSILRALRSNKSLWGLHMRGVKVSLQDYKDAKAMYERSFPLVALTIDSPQEASKSEMPNAAFTSKTLSELGLTHFPAALLLATGLQSLNLAHNRITSLPENISVLTNLRSLDLRWNALDVLPSSLGQLTTLKQLKLVPGNSIRTPADDKWIKLADEKPEKLLGFFRDLRMGTEQIRRVKLMIVGQENVGKTTLLRKLAKTLSKSNRNKTKEKAFGELYGCGGDQSLNDKAMQLRLTGAKPASQLIKKKKATQYLSTDGIDIQDMTIDVIFAEDRLVVVPTKPSDDDEIPTTERVHTQEKRVINLSAWDFAGQEVYYTTHQFFFSDHCVYLLVWDMRKPEEDSKVAYWLQSIQSQSASASVILVGTYLDDPKCLRAEYLEEIFTSIKRKYRQFSHLIRCIVPVSSYGDMSELIAALREVLTAQKILFQTVPRTYIELERALSAERASAAKSEWIPVKSWAQLRETAIAVGITTEDETRKAAEFLRNMGSLIWFDDPTAGLDDVVITDSQFLSRVFATIVTTKQNYVRDGVLDHSNLLHIWKAPRFPPHLQQQLLALMEKFEVSYRVHGEMAKTLGISAEKEKVGTSIVPSLLPNARPFMSLLWKPWDGTQYEQYCRIYEMLFIPKGLFSRFLFRLLHYCTHLVTLWRSGIIAAARDSLFLVEEFENKKWIMVTVKEGTNPKQRFREILEILDALLANGQWAIDTKKRIPCPHCIIQLTTAGINVVDVAASDMPPRKTSMAVATTTIEPMGRGRDSPAMLSPAPKEHWSGFRSIEALPTRFLATRSQRAVAAAASPVNSSPPRLQPENAPQPPNPRLAELRSNNNNGEQTQMPTQTAGRSSQPGAFSSSSELLRLISKTNLMPYLFAFEKCQQKAVSGDWFVECRFGSQMIRLDTIAPDLTLSDFEGVQIPVTELEFVAKLGQGAQGAVWKALWKGRMVAVKELFPPPGKVSETVVEAFDEFRREVWMMSSLHHPNVVKLLGFCVKPNNLIVMEYIPNKTLFDWLSDPSKDISWPQRLRIAIDVALGLRFLHSASPPLIHRDIKSPNIMVVSSDPFAKVVAKLADFGLSSRLYIPFLKEKTQTRRIGNPHWLAPEVMREEEYIETVDTYSYGLILWELVAREIPYIREFHEMGEKIGPLEDKIMRGYRPHIPSECPASVVQLIQACWHNAPHQRPTWDNIIVALLRIAEELDLAGQFGVPDECFSSSKMKRIATRLGARTFSSTESVTSSSSSSSSSPMSTTPSKVPALFKSKGKYVLSSIGSRRVSGDSNRARLVSKRSDVQKHIAPPAHQQRASISGSDESSEDRAVERQGASSSKISAATVRSGAFLCRGTFAAETTAPSPVKCMTAAQEQPFIWAGHEDGTISIWDSTTGMLISKSTEAHKGAVNYLSKIGDTIWSCSSADTTIKGWKLEMTKREEEQADMSGWLKVLKPGKKKPSKRWVAIQDQTLKAFKLHRPPRKPSEVAGGQERLIVRLETANVSFPPDRADAITISSKDNESTLATLFLPSDEAAAWHRALEQVGATSRAALRNTRSFAFTNAIRAISPIQTITSNDELVCLSVKDELIVRDAAGAQTHVLPLRNLMAKAEKWEDSKLGHALTILDHSIWAGVGDRVTIVDSVIWRIAAVFTDHKSPIIDIVPVLSALEMWCLDASGAVSRWPLALEEDDTDIHDRGGIISLSTEARHKITSLYPVGPDVWAGTSAGDILIISPSAKKVTKILEKRHQAAVEAMCAWHHTMWCSDRAGLISTWS